MTEMPEKENLRQRGIKMNPIADFSAVSHPLLASEENLDEGVVQSPIDDRGTKTARSRPITHRGRNYFQGWKFTIFGAFTASLIVLFFNLGFLLYCVTHSKHDAVDLYPIAEQDAYRAQIKHQIGTLLFEGNCAEVHRLSTGFHLVINILSTTLLSASNFGMVCGKMPHSNFPECALGCSKFHVAMFSRTNTALYRPSTRKWPLV